VPCQYLAKTKRNETAVNRVPRLPHRTTVARHCVVQAPLSCESVNNATDIRDACWLILRFNILRIACIVHGSSVLRTRRVEWNLRTKGEGSRSANQVARTATAGLCTMHARWKEAGRWRWNDRTNRMDDQRKKDGKPQEEGPVFKALFCNLMSSLK